ncbi:MAG: helix-turn-helix transcriptional regulator [Lachnospiraceae bacterium]|nr:helix-turn-helix transcriptional regulator [Lachnospiraceae bacterium]
MKIGTIGYNNVHGKDFCIDRPNGPGSYLLLIIKTPARFWLEGQEHAVKKNSFILLSPDTRCRYQALEDYYTDDWMHFDIEEGDHAMFAKYGIPVDKLVHLGNATELSQIMHILTYEHYSAGEYREEIEVHYLSILMLKLSRLIVRGGGASSEMLIERNGRLTELKSLMYAAPCEVPDVGAMAERIGMSYSGFQHFYKKMFGVAVMTDVINGRVEYAKRLLCTTNLTVAEVAEQCGYRNEYHFMRQFREKVGKTPTEYRKSI